MTTTTLAFFIPHGSQSVSVLVEVMSSNDNVMKAIRDLSSKFDSLQEDVNVLKNEPPRSKLAASTPQMRSWADRMEQQDPEDQVYYGEQITWGDEPGKLTQVSDETSELLAIAFMQSVDKATRNSTRRGFIVLDSPHLDSVLKADTSQQTEALD